MDMEQREAVKVAFRADRAGEFKDVVTAVFSGDADRGELTCYGHVGQHGTCSRVWYWDRTRPATAAEYADLLAELTAIGYDVAVVQRVSWK